MDPKIVQNRAPEAPKTLLEPGCRWKLFPEPRKSCSRLGAELIFAKIADGAREPKIDPKRDLWRKMRSPEPVFYRFFSFSCFLRFFHWILVDFR